MGSNKLLPSSVRRRGGFTLIEVMTALVIFSVAIIAFIQSTGTTTAIQSDLVASERAAMLARNVMEETRLSGTLEEETQSGDFEDEDAAYAWSTDVEESETKNLMKVTVTISWNDGRGKKDYSLSTLMARENTLQ